MRTQDANPDAPAQVVPDAIIAVATGFMAAKHLFVASEFGLFAALADGLLPLDAVAERTGVPRASVRILADAMAALGFVARDGDQYRNQPVAQAYLSGQSPADLRPALRFFDQISYPTWRHLEEALRTRRGVRGELSADQNAIRSRGIEAITAPAAQALSRSCDFTERQRLLDLGGGLGAFLRILMQHYPHLDATLFETPAVAALARQALSAAPHGAHIAVVAGDFFRHLLSRPSSASSMADVPRRPLWGLRCLRP